MKYLLDTDIIIFWLKGNEKIEEKAVSVGLEKIVFSVISKAELYFGAYNSQRVKKNIKNIQRVSQTLAMLQFDEIAAKNKENRLMWKSRCLAVASTTLVLEIRSENPKRLACHSCVCRNLPGSRTEAGDSGTRPE